MNYILFIFLNFIKPLKIYQIFHKIDQKLFLNSFLQKQACFTAHLCYRSINSDPLSLNFFCFLSSSTLWTDPIKTNHKFLFSILYFHFIYLKRKPFPLSIQKFVSGSVKCLKVNSNAVCVHFFIVSKKNLFFTALKVFFFLSLAIA